MIVVNNSRDKGSYLDITWSQFMSFFIVGKTHFELAVFSFTWHKKEVQFESSLK